MALQGFPRVVAYNASSAALVANGATVTLWTAQTGGSQLQTYDSVGTPISVATEGGTVPPVYLQDVDSAWYDAGAGRFQVWASNFGAVALQAATVAAQTAAQFDTRLSLVESLVAAGGGGTGGGQLGLVEDVFTIAADNGSTLIGPGGTTVSRTAFTYSAVPTGHRLVIKDHPNFVGSATQPQLPAAFWSEAAKAQPQAEFISVRTPAAG